MMLEACLLIQLVACCAMTGIIWMVQIAVYPLFGRLEEPAFSDYHHRYTRQVTWVIAPLMFLEATSGAACLFLGEWSDFLVPSLLLGLIWASTAFIQVPQHQRLTRANVPALVRSNWIRTAAWTARSGFLFSLSLRLFSDAG